MQSSYIIDGKKKAFSLLEDIKKRVEFLFQEHSIKVGLAVIIVGDDPASLIYVKTKARRAEELGIKSFVYQLAKNTTEEEILNLIAKLNADIGVNGILVQLPIPDHINTQNIIDAIDYRKDVDGFSTYNVGLLNSWQESFEPCTPQGVMILLHDIYDDLPGKKAVVLGRSRIVGRPMVSLLIKEGCSVMSLNSNSRNIKEECQAAEIVISAVGSPLFIKRDWIKKGACVIDVGIIRVNDKLCGDVDFENVKDVAGFITPVPGGVGPMTVACLMMNTMKAAYKQYKILWE